MDKKGIVNFSSFFPGITNEEKKPFNKEDFKDFFLDTNSQNTQKKAGKLVKETKKEEDEVEYPEEVVKSHEEPKLDSSFDPPVDPEEFVIDELPDMEPDEETHLPSIKEEIESESIDDDYYTVYKDKFENFTCNVFVEGAKINNTKARLVLESEDWNLVFEGDIDNYGKCTIPIKKLNILDEGLVGKIRLEVIAENTIFTPWEDDFKVRLNKKVLVEMPKRNLPKETTVKVNFRK